MKINKEQLEKLGLWLEEKDATELSLGLKLLNFNNKKTHQLTLASGKKITVTRIIKKVEGSDSIQYETILSGKVIGDGNYASVRAALILDKESIVQLKQGFVDEKKIIVGKKFQPVDKYKKRDNHNRKSPYDIEKNNLITVRRLYGTKEETILTTKKDSSEVVEIQKKRKTLFEQWEPGVNLQDDEKEVKINEQFSKLPLARQLRMLALIAIELQKLHDKDFIHRDIKPSNIMVYIDENNPENDRAAIVDFGSGTTDPNEKFKSQGNRFYMAIESFTADEENYINDKISDLYSLYVTFAKALNLTQDTLTDGNIRTIMDPDRKLVIVSGVTEHNEALKTLQENLQKGTGSNRDDRPPLTDMTTLLLQTAKILDPTLPEVKLPTIADAVKDTASLIELQTIALDKLKEQINYIDKIHEAYTDNVDQYNQGKYFSYFSKHGHTGKIRAEEHKNLFKENLLKNIEKKFTTLNESNTMKQAYIKCLKDILLTVKNNVIEAYDMGSNLHKESYTSFLMKYAEILENELSRVNKSETINFNFSLPNTVSSFSNDGEVKKKFKEYQKDIKELKNNKNIEFIPWTNRKK